MMIRSNPPGAMVYVDDYPVGITPCAANFTYYGTRKIRLEKAGFQTKTVLQPLPAPWYQIPPLDAITDNLTLNQIRDVRNIDFTLEPMVMTPTDQVLQRAEELRRGAQPGAVGPPATSTGAPYVPPRNSLETIAPPNY